MLDALFDVGVIGGGSTGLAAALAADECGAKTLLIERESYLGGKLKQCTYDGFGLVRFGEKLTGQQYAFRFIRRLSYSRIKTALSTFVSKVEKKQKDIELTLVNREGISKITCKSLVLACGSREDTSCRIGITGKELEGIYSAGTVLYYKNISFKIPIRRCVIFGSDNIALIAAQRLKHEGAEVLGIYDEKPTAGGLARNADNIIPIYTGKTITRVFGEERVTAVEITSVDKNMIPVPDTEQVIECDALIISGGLVPENELAENLDIPIDTRTKGPVTDQNYMTMLDGVFCCGNALQIYDLADYASESGELAGKAAAKFSAEKNSRSFVKIAADDSLLYVVPKKLNVKALNEPVVVSFRPKKEMSLAFLSVILDGKEAYRKFFSRVRPPAMESLEIDFKKLNIKSGSRIRLSLSEVV